MKGISKNRIWLIIVVSSILTTLVFNLPRMALAIGENLPQGFPISYDTLVIQLIATFIFCLIIYSYHLILKVGFKQSFWIKTGIDVGFSLFLVVLFLRAQLFLLSMNEASSDASPINTRYGLLSFLLIAMIAGFVGYMVKLISSNQQRLLENERLKKENFENQLNALKNHIDPHFLFNSLNTLSGLTIEDPQKARKFIQNLSALLRNRLKTDSEDLITVAKELTFLNHYVALLKDRFEENFNIAMEVEDNYLQKKIPSFSLQQLVENAIKHNEISTAYPLNISIKSEDSYLIVCNKIQKKLTLEPSTKSGLLNLQKRFQLLKKQSIIIENNSRFTVKLPL